MKYMKRITQQLYLMHTHQEAVLENSILSGPLQLILDK